MPARNENPIERSQGKLTPKTVPEVLEEVELSQGEETGSYGQILKSSVLIGGSSVLNIAIGIVRTKLFAVLLGPVGFGLFGIYGSVSNLVQSIAGMGINSSGVRQIAYAMGTEDEKKISTTITVMRRTSILLGFLGGVFLVVFSRPVSAITFGNVQHWGPIAFLGLAVLFQLIANGEGAVIQGVQHISDLARVSVWGALLGTVFSIPIVYFLRERGVVPSLVCVALMTLGVSWRYGRRVKIRNTRLTATETGREASELLKLGLVFMTSYVTAMGNAYVVRMIVLRDLGFAATGYYQSAWTLGGLYVGFILQAMGTDFYPRLTANSDDNDACNRLINDQTQVGLLLGGPGVLATVTLAPLVISLFYSAKFGAAVGVLRWIALGAILQVITWPLSYMIVAKNRRLLYLVSEVARGVVGIVFAWVLVRYFGLKGAGIAFFGVSVIYGLLLWPIAKRLSDFKWSSANLKAGGLFLFLIGVVFIGFATLPFAVAFCAGMIAIIAGSFYAIRTVTTLVSLDRVPPLVRRILARLGMVSSQICID